MLRGLGDNKWLIDHWSRNEGYHVYHFHASQLPLVRSRIASEAIYGLLTDRDVEQLYFALDDVALMEALPPIRKPSIIARLVAWFFKAQDAECCGK